HPGPALREVADQHIGPRHSTRRTVRPLAEHVVADDGHALAGRHPGDGGARVLVLDLQVVADRVAHQVVLDRARDEGVLAVGVAEVHPCAGTHDRVAANDPVPVGRGYGRDADVLLVAADPRDGEVREPDVVVAALGGHAGATQVAAVDLQVADDHPAAVLDPHRVVRGTAQELRAGAGFGTSD